MSIAFGQSHMTTQIKIVLMRVILSYGYTVDLRA